MDKLELIVLAIGLAMDAFAVAVCKGLEVKNINLNKCAIVGFYFGFFQFLMPIIGYILGNYFKNIIISIDHWIAFFLLLSIGVNMIKESFSKEESNENSLLNFKTMLPLSIAVSIDALAVGITLSILNINLLVSTITIGIITFILSSIGVLLGNKIGSKITFIAKLLGGIILIFIGIKILITHLK